MEPVWNLAPCACPSFDNPGSKNSALEYFLLTELSFNSVEPVQYSDFLNPGRTPSGSSNTTAGTGIYVNRGKGTTSPVNGTQGPEINGLKVTIQTMKT